MTLLTTRQAAEYLWGEDNSELPRFEKKLRVLRYAGDGPSYFKIGRLCYYDTDELDAWVETYRRGLPVPERKRKAERLLAEFGADPR